MQQINRLVLLVRFLGVSIFSQTSEEVAKNKSIVDKISL
jgi:hypothetical protein